MTFKGKIKLKKNDIFLDDAKEVVHVIGGRYKRHFTIPLKLLLKDESIINFELIGKIITYWLFIKDKTDIKWSKDPQYIIYDYLVM